MFDKDKDDLISRVMEKLPEEAKPLLKDIEFTMKIDFYMDKIDALNKEIEAIKLDIRKGSIPLNYLHKEVSWVLEEMIQTVVKPFEIIYHSIAPIIGIEKARETIRDMIYCQTDKPYDLRKEVFNRINFNRNHSASQ